MEGTPEEVSKNLTGIGQKFLATLERKGIITESDEFEKEGVAAQGGTNETGNPSLFEKVRNQQEAPNGYLIGIGAANVFSMLEAFPEGTKPKAIILFDIDPEVVAYGQRLIEEMKNQPDHPITTLNPDEKVFYENKQADTKIALKKYYPLLQQLAKEGNLVIAKADLTDPKVLLQLYGLPGWKESNNLFYLSNIADHIWRRNSSKLKKPFLFPNFILFGGLAPTAPHRNYFIDTTTRSLDYCLRIGTQPPKFESSDFMGNPFPLPPSLRKPTDCIGS